MGFTIYVTNILALIATFFSIRGNKNDVRELRYLTLLRCHEGKQESVFGEVKF